MTKSYIGVMCLQVREHQGLPGTRRMYKETWKNLFLELYKRLHGPADTFILEFKSPEL